MQIPNFFIIGAPKCGTTSLFSYLGQHPKVFVSRVKEPHYFCTDLPTIRRYVEREKYLRLYEGANPEHLAVGEASTRYLYSRAAVKNIVEFNPDAKFIAMLRNPIDLAHSLHSQVVYDLTEDETDFETAWKLQSQRAEGQRLPGRCRHVNHLQYGSVAKLGEQVERVLAQLPRNRLKLVLFDDFKASPQSVCESVLDFLGVPNDFELRFDRVNANKVWRFPALARLLGNPPFPLDRIKDGLKRSLGLMETSIATVIYARLSVSQDRPAMSKAMRDELAEYFQQDVEKLSELLSRDLTHWLSEDSAATVSAVSQERTSVALGQKSFAA